MRQKKFGLATVFFLVALRAYQIFKIWAMERKEKNIRVGW